MAHKEHSGKALPILTIVFSGVSLLLFGTKFILCVAKSILTENLATRQAMEKDLLRTLPICFAAVFFIIFASMVLRRSPHSGKLLITALAAQIVSSGFIVARMLLTGNQNVYYYALFSLIIVFCLAAIVLYVKQKSIRAVMALAASSGIMIAAIYFLKNVFGIAHNSAFFFAHRFLLISSLLIALCFTTAMVFYYIAFLFMGLYKKPEPMEEKKEPVKVVIKNK